MKRYKVIKPQGVRTVAGDLKKKGETFLASDRSATTQLLLRCQEIEEVKEGKESKAPATVDELKAALTELGIKFPDDAKKADLEKLYADATATKE